MIGNNERTNTYFLGEKDIRLNYKYINKLKL